jgi:hypothetical protein
VFVSLVVKVNGIDCGIITLRCSRSAADEILAELMHAPYPPLMNIRGPTSEERGEDRCELELEATFQALVWKAVAAGWDEGEACVAIASLADHHVLAMQCNDLVTEQITAGAGSGVVLRKSS